MKIKIPYLIAVIVATASLSYLADTPALSASPLLALKTITGLKVDLAESQGKTRLVSFWAPDCPICHRDIPNLSGLHRQFTGDELEIVAIAMPYASEEEVLSHVDKQDIQYPIVHDTDGSISKSFPGVRFTPTTFLIDDHGTIIWRQVGELDAGKVASHIAAHQHRLGRTLAHKDR